MSKNFNLESKIRAALRNVSKYWPPAQEALKEAKIGPNLYRCASCGKGFQRDQVQRDHIVPVGTLKMDALTEWAQRLFIPKEGYQILCTTKCHIEKTLRQKAEKDGRKKQLG